MRLSKLTKLLFGLFCLVILQIITSGFPGGLNNSERACSSSGCHGSGNQGTMTVTGLPPEVTPNTTYSVEVCINDPINVNGIGGFRFWFQNSPGSFSNLGTGVRTGGNGTNEGVTHNNPKSIVNGLVCWNFDWTSSASGNNNLLVYGNAANGNGDSDSGDQGGYVYAVVIPTVDPCPVDLTVQENPIPTGTYQASNSILANTPISLSATVILDATNFIDLESDFEVPLGADFEALTGAGQGCPD